MRKRKREKTKPVFLDVLKKACHPERSVTKPRDLGLREIVDFPASRGPSTSFWTLEAPAIALGMTGVFLSSGGLFNPAQDRGVR